MYGCSYSVAVFILHSQAKLAHDVFTHASVPTCRPNADSVLPSTLSIALPLCPDGFQQLCRTALQCLKNNFYSFFLAVSGGVMAHHYEKVLEIQDECPLVLCYSASCGTGELGMYIFIATVTVFIARYTVLLYSTLFRSHASTHNNRQNCNPEDYSERFRFRGSVPSKEEGYCLSTASPEQPVLIPYLC